MDIIKGKTWTFGKNIDTDVIIPGRYLRTFNPQDLADHVLEGERPDFTKNVKKGDVIVADENFGCGSSREQAPVAIKTADCVPILLSLVPKSCFRKDLEWLQCIRIPTCESTAILTCSSRTVMGKQILWKGSRAR